MRSPKPRKDEAASVVRLLTESAVALSSSNPLLAEEQADLARRVKLRFNVRVDDSLRRFTCRGCKGLLVPGVNARVRLGHGKETIVRVTCARCGHVNRKIVNRA